jgi:hypothetical protein
MDCRIAVALVVYLSLVAGTHAARAQPANEAAAETLFREGRDLLEQRQYDEACRKLADSYRLDPASGTLLGLAMCHEGQGKLASAWLEYKQVIARAGPEGRADRQRAATERAQALESRLSTIAVIVPVESRATDLQVSYDGQPIGAAAWSTAFPVDPGPHHLEATAPGKRSWRSDVVIGAEAEHRTIAVSPLEDAVRPVAAPQPERPRSTTRRSPVMAFTLAGAGVVAVGVGSALGLRALHQKNESESMGCLGDACPNAAARDTRLAAGRAADAATVALVAGGALLTGGALVYWLRGPEPAPGVASRGPSLAFGLAPRAAWIEGTF